MKTRFAVCIVENASIDHMLTQSQEEFLALFTEEEQQYCLAHKKKESHLAARFAAKKVVYTVLGARAEIQWNTIFVRKHASGFPYLCLTGIAAEYARMLKIMHWHLSLTHTESYAAALVIAEEYEERGKS